MEINVANNITGLTQVLNLFGKDQLPFALANAMTSTAFDVRKQIIGPTWDNAFDIRNKKFSSQSFRIKKAKKNDLHASFYQVKVRGYYRASLDLHAEGGNKLPKDGTLALPSYAIKTRRRGRGVPEAWKAKNVLAKPRTFVASMPSGARGIWQREGKARLPIRRLYTFDKKVKIQKDFLFFKDGSTIVRKNLDRNFKKSYKNAMRSAKPKRR
jgi:hypothetical protein|tara:strand:+ start:314 stop:949 length:636 start_codon:yes stop_codon:yes gene_type:complete